MSKLIKKYGVTEIIFNIWEERSCDGQADGIQVDLENGIMLHTPAIDMLLALEGADKAYGFLSVMFPIADIEIDRIDLADSDVDHDQLDVDDQAEEDINWDDFIDDTIASKENATLTETFAHIKSLTLNNDLTIKLMELDSDFHRGLITEKEYISRIWMNIIQPHYAEQSLTLCDTCDDAECVANPRYAEQIVEPLAM
jgi:hypothetical protein